MLSLAELKVFKNLKKESKMTAWQTLGQHEYEYTVHGYTNWYRCVGGRLADGRWPEWNSKTGDNRYS